MIEETDIPILDILSRKRGVISIEEGNIILSLYKKYVNKNYHTCGCQGEDVRLWGDLMEYYRDNK